jgi:hypothetical protein
MCLLTTKTKLVKNIGDWKRRNQAIIQCLNLQEEIKNNLAFPRHYSSLTETEKTTLLDNISTQYKKYKSIVSNKRTDDVIQNLVLIRQKEDEKEKQQKTWGSIYKEKKSLKFRWNENGKQKSKNFYIGEGGEAEAKEKIEEFRKTRLEDECEYKKHSNGCIYKDISKNSFIFQWRKGGKKYSKSFSINKYGEEGAKDMCENYRKTIFSN